MTRRHIGVGIFLLVAAASAGCGAKKKVVTKDQFKATSDYIFKNMNGNSHPNDERKNYTIGQLGAPHRVDGEKQSWYTAPSECYYYEMKADGWGSWGTGSKDDCDKYAAK
jgi:hypothetical protein